MLCGALGHSQQYPDPYHHAQRARHVENGRPATVARGQGASGREPDHDAEWLGCEEEGHHPGALPGRRPLAQQLVAGREEEALCQALHHARRAHAVHVAVGGARRHEQVEEAGHEHGHGEEALGPEALRQLARRDVHHHVPPEEGREHQAGAAGVPVKMRLSLPWLRHGDDGHRHVGPSAERDGCAEEHDEGLDVPRADELAGAVHATCGVGVAVEPVHVLLGGGDHDGGGAGREGLCVVVLLLGGHSGGAAVLGRHPQQRVHLRGGCATRAAVDRCVADSTVPPGLLLLVLRHVVGERRDEHRQEKEGGVVVSVTTSSPPSLILTLLFPQKDDIAQHHLR